MNLNKIHNVYFIGVGGIGMSAIARYFSVNGKIVAGYDKVETPITNSLKSVGIEIHFDDAVKNIPLSFLDKESTVVVYTPAVSDEHQELTYFKANNYTVLKRAEILGEITKNSFCLGVAGTHGKTTTSSILGHIMAPVKATSFLGGIAENYNSNLILGGEEVSVVEADEFDRSFLKLSPNIACITSMDADHLDIYGEADALEQSFREFANKVTDTLIIAKGLPIEGLTYAINDEADYMAFDIEINDGAYVFSVKTPTKLIKNIEFYLPGRHNLMNALAAFAMADVYGVSLEVIKEQLKTFKGVQRRFSYKIKTNSVVLIDDYAHHPTEINAIENSVREMYPNEKVLAVFQPHLFSRTQDFSDDFSRALSKFDEVLMLDIYPARELPIKGVTSSWLLDKMSLENKKLTTKQKIVQDVLKSEAKIIVMIGAGDIGLLVNDVKVKLEEKYKV
ncbi:UDP-N-acetylmuramate--L-alanine ligase [Tenacibaculum sp. E3R01]|uniref:UDP-N-acetylmuramate--L-alanine ligase n=1 Tax=unclassified Tenacibaculum TaxID=2635139 RepID=UPI00089D2213|nr:MULTISPECIES: UDP-N-acetylmuramate--L-alanine ligase [unclassified Tenacibaculum]RBW56939.1 UDP-N-acetylmuramate--L-alanine ligase [Tenacibaculum sp. E3R01]SED40708.1 UDP-N-acetylmuramate--L-alanine ligase [Tenacibaculum sp. MAR_2010_89]